MSPLCCCQLSCYYWKIQKNTQGLSVSVFNTDHVKFTADLKFVIKGQIITRNPDIKLENLNSWKTQDRFEYQDWANVSAGTFKINIFD